MNVLVTGGAGFIGSHLVERLLDKGYRITIVDNFDSFYARDIKLSNISNFIRNPNVTFFEIDILDFDKFQEAVQGDFDAIIHLAAKAGVRPSILNPVLYQDVNVKGTQNLLEFAKIRNIRQFVFGSSSSVYGINPRFPWKESDPMLLPISPYASTKLSGELLGHVYSHLYDIRFIALRFFTVYGPRQRPDLAIHLFSKKILNGQPIDFYGNGLTERDYTYVSDIVQGIMAAVTYSASMYEVINLGNNKCTTLKDLVSGLEEVLGTKAIYNFLPEQPGDVKKTNADISKASALLGYSPQTDIATGLGFFRDWLIAQRSPV